MTKVSLMAECTPFLDKALRSLPSKLSKGRGRATLEKKVSIKEKQEK